MIAPCMVSSASDDWPTSPAFFAMMAHRFGPFDIDVAASVENAKCPRYFTREQDGLRQTWTGRCWCNPPYGRQIAPWIRKAAESAQAGALVVCLLPARVDTAWWQDFVLPFAEVEFVRGRLRFGSGEYPAPFPSAIVIFRPATTRRCQRCERPFRPARTDAKFCGSGCKQAAYRARRVTALSVTAPAAEPAAMPVPCGGALVPVPAPRVPVTTAALAAEPSTDNKTGRPAKAAPRFTSPIPRRLLCQIYPPLPRRQQSGGASPPSPGHPAPAEGDPAPVLGLFRATHRRADLPV
jgi:phage N-6-adenine-methyltransferase